MLETTGTDYTWVALPLNVSGLNMASDLKAHVEANASASVSVLSISEWTADAQGWQTYTTVPAPSGDFGLSCGSAYQIEVDVSSGNSVVWTQVGQVPAAGSSCFTLKETTGTDYNWVMLPLDKAAITMTCEMKPDVDANASPAATAVSISEWNATAQSFQTYTTIPSPCGDFATRCGHPYQIEIDVAVGTSTTWP